MDIGATPDLPISLLLLSLMAAPRYPPDLLHLPELEPLMIEEEEREESDYDYPLSYHRRTCGHPARTYTLFGLVFGLLFCLCFLIAAVVLAMHGSHN